MPRVLDPLSRREVLKFGAFTTVGGVLTPGISMAQAIMTDTRDIVARDVTISHSGQLLPAYEARPDAAGPMPVVLVISGFTGNSDQQKDVVRRFAHAGYYAISPDLYFRSGSMQGKSFQQMSAIAGRVTRAQYLDDLKANADYARHQAWARADRLGVTGFCGGGALTLHFTAEYPGVTAAVSWYGHVKRTYPDAPGVDAFAIADKIKAPVLGLYGEADTGIAPADVKAFEKTLKDKGNDKVEFVLYPGAPHAFFSDDRPQVYKKAAAEDGWKRCLAFFEKYLRA